jgi:hypothetical protein
VILDLRFQTFLASELSSNGRKSRTESWLDQIGFGCRQVFAFADCGYQLGFGHRSHA